MIAIVCSGQIHTVLAEENSEQYKIAKDTIYLEGFAVVTYKNENQNSIPANEGNQQYNNFSIPQNNTCSMCHGSGICQACNGRRRTYVTGYGVTEGKYIDCSGCNGSGKCWRCGGGGKE